ncbi:hypothetical protein D3C85_1278840 [compost metagenome]
MPWLPLVQALDVGIRRPVRPKKMLILAAVVCGIIRTYVLAFRPSATELVSMLPKVLSSSVLPVDDPQATPMRPSRIEGSSSSPASRKAISEAATARRETRPMLRNCLRVQCDGTLKSSMGPARRVLSSMKRSHSSMRRIPLWLAPNRAAMLSQSWPRAVMPAMPVTTTRFISIGLH